MPFCRECGKGVEEDWVTCPFCSQPIGPPAARVAEISDSVVMGDVNVNDSAAISSAISTASSCVQCGSIGAVQIPCKDCKELICCEQGDCKWNSKNKLILELKKEKLVSCFSDEKRLPGLWGEISDGDVLSGRCLKCAVKIIKEKRTSFGNCSYCGLITTYSGFREQTGNKIKTSNEKSKDILLSEYNEGYSSLDSLALEHILCSNICPEFLEQRNQIPNAILESWKDSGAEYISGFETPADIFKPIKNVYARRKLMRLDLSYYFGCKEGDSTFDAILIKNGENIVDLMLPFGEQIGGSMHHENIKRSYENRQKVIFTIEDYNNKTSNYVLYDFTELTLGYPSGYDQSLRKESLDLYNQVNNKNENLELEFIEIKNKYGDGNDISNYREIREFLEKYDSNFSVDDY